MDIAHIARQTAIMNELLDIYNKLPAQHADRQAFRDTIETMQRGLYPWITRPIWQYNSYNSFFDLIDSYTEEAGIVICMSEYSEFRWTIHQIVTLRGVLNCNLPIEIFYGFDNDDPGLMVYYRDFLEMIKAAFSDDGPITVVDINGRFPDSDDSLSLYGSSAMRPFAILASSFKNVILIGADTIFLQDPSILLEQPAYEKYGAMFWHDRLDVNPVDIESFLWLEDLLESAKAKNIARVRESPWFRHEALHEMDRYLPNNVLLILFFF